jgi:hypothetical protein
MKKPEGKERIGSGADLGAQAQRPRQSGLRPDPGGDYPDVANRPAPHANLRTRNTSTNASIAVCERPGNASGAFTPQTFLRTLAMITSVTGVLSLIRSGRPLSGRRSLPAWQRPSGPKSSPGVPGKSGQRGSGFCLILRAQRVSPEFQGSHWAIQTGTNLSLETFVPLQNHAPIMSEYRIRCSPTTLRQ